MKSLNWIKKELATLNETQLLLVFLNVVEVMGELPADSVQRWHDIMVNVPAPPRTRESVLFVEPCIIEFLQKLAEKKRLMT